MTGAVDLVLPVAKIPGLLAKYVGECTRTCAPDDARATRAERLTEIIDLLRRNGRTISRSTSRARCCAGSSGAWRWRRSTTAAGISSCCERLRRARTPRQGSADQRHQLLPRPEGLRPSGGEGHPRSRPPAAGGPAAADLGCRLQHRRGDLFARHALSRGDRGGEAQYQDCRSSLPMSTRMRSLSPARASTRNRSRRMCRRRGSPASLPRRTMATG